MISYRLQYIVLIGILIYFFFQNIWGVRFTTGDDSSIMLWAHLDLNEQFKIIENNYAKHQGRLYFYYHPWYLIFIQMFWDTIIYDVLQTGSHLLSIILITYTLNLYTNNKHYLIYPLIYISITTITWEHTLTTSVPLYHFIYLIKLCSIFILIYKFNDKPSKIKLYSIYIIYCLSILGHEYQFIISYLSVLLSIFLIKNKTYKQKFTYPITLITLVYIIAAILFYINAKNSYDGAVINLNQFNFTYFLGIIIEWSLSGNIFYEIFADNELFLDLNFDSSFTKRIPVISQIKLEPKSFLFIVVIYFLLKSLETWSNPRFISRKEKIVVFIFFMIIITIPQIFLGLTPKYQAWYSNGTLSYTYTSLSNFAVCIVINKMISFFLNSYNFSAKSILFIIISIVFLINNSFNNVTSNAMKESTSKWFAWDIFMKSPYSYLQKSIRAPRFTHRFWHTPNHEEYWHILTHTLYHNNSKLLIESNNLSSDSNKFIDYYNFNNEIIVLYGELFNNEYIINPVLLAKENSRINYEYINDNGRIISGRSNFNQISNNLYEYKINEVVRFNTLRFTNKYLNGYVYPINNLLKIGEKIEFTNTSFKRFHLGKDWSGNEGDFVWGYGRDSSINFSINEIEKCDPLLEFAIEPLQINEESKLELIMNNNLIKEFRPASEIKTYIFDLDESLYNRSNTLIFRNNFFATPESLNLGNDGRLLSFRLHYFKILCK